MTKKQLVARLKECSTGDQEGDHSRADQLLIDYINDPEVAKVYEEIHSGHHPVRYNGEQKRAARWLRTGAPCSAAGSAGTAPGRYGPSIRLIQRGQE